MSFFRELIDSLLAFWRSLGNGSRVMVVISGLVVIVAVAVVGMWSSRPHYIPLASGLAPAETAEIVSRLEAKGIKNELNFSGSTVMVAKNEWNRARMLVDDVATFTTSTSEFDSGMLGDPDMNHYKLMKHREDALASTIRRMHGIANASVHIAISKKSPFQHERETTTASVVLEVRSGTSISREQSAAVVAFVAGSVEGLDPAGVSVMDTHGHVLSSRGSGVDSSVGAHFEFRRQLESELAAKASTMLLQLLGEGRAVVRVSADLDFTRLQREETTFDPDLKVRKSEENRTMSKVAELRRIGGVAGTATNVSGADTSEFGEPPIKETEEFTTTTYENTKTVDTVNEAPGQIKRLTIAVMADLTVDEPVSEDDESADDAPTEEPAQLSVTRENIESIVKQAVGFDQERGDEIEVLISKFHATKEPEPKAAALPWDKVNKVVRNASLGLAALVALAMGLMTLKKMKPITIPTEPEASGADKSELLSSLSEKIQSNPETLQAIISSWMTEDQHKSNNSNERRAA